MENQRFQQIWKNDNAYYSSGSPLLLEKSAIYYDAQKSLCIGQIRWKNISEKTVRAFQIRLLCYDSFHEMIGWIGFEYNSIQAKPSQVFGMDKAIIIANTKVGIFDVVVLAVSFNDDTVWNGESDALYTPLPSPKRLDLTESLREQLFRDIKKKGITREYKNAVQMAKGLWQCACGSWQRKGNPCDDCGAEMSYLQWAMTPATLETNLELYLAEQEKKKREMEERAAREQSERDEQERLRLEKARHEEEQRITAEKHKQRRKRRIRRSLLATFILIILALSVDVYHNAYKPYREYVHATEMIETNQFGDAVEALNKVERSKNAYWNAEIWDYMADVGGYADYKDLKQKANYFIGEELLNDGLFVEARKCFEKAGDYEDSITMIKECQYQEANALLNENRLEEAATIYVDLWDYRDVQEKVQGSDRLFVLTQRIMRKNRESEVANPQYYYSNDNKYMARCYDFTETGEGQYSFTMEVCEAANRYKMGRSTIEHIDSEKEREYLGFSDDYLQEFKYVSAKTYQVKIQFDLLYGGVQRTGSYSMQIEMDF